jgi:hypothetical protein
MKILNYYKRMFIRLYNRIESFFDAILSRYTREQLFNRSFLFCVLSLVVYAINAFVADEEASNILTVVQLFFLFIQIILVIIGSVRGRE